MIETSMKTAESSRHAFELETIKAISRAATTFYVSFKRRVAYKLINSSLPVQHSKRLFQLSEITNSISSYQGSASVVHVSCR